MTVQGSMRSEAAHPPAGPAGAELDASLDRSPDPRGMVSKGIEALLGSSLRRPLAVLVLVMIDTLALLVGLMLAEYLVTGESQVGTVIYFAPVLLAVWLAIFVACGLYDRASGSRNLAVLSRALLWGTGFLIAGSMLYPQSGFSVREILLGTLFVIPLEGGLRSLYDRAARVIYRQKLGLIPIIIIGEDEERERVRQVLEKTPNAYACVGELGTSGEAFELSLLRQLLDRTRARNIILAGAERFSDAQFLSLLGSAWLRKVKVKVIPSAAALVSSDPVLSQDMGIPLLEVGYPRLDNRQWALKRLLDITGSLVGLAVLSPLFIGVSALIKLTSSGPVFFRQKRAGADEKVFVCYKFRSMYQDAERRLAELEAQNQADGAIFKIKDDPRITPVGRIIRRCSIDELPQLINVLKGEMSLVGPRPLPIRDFERMSELHKKRLATMPGITGYWQISGRSDLSFEEMIRLDLYYIENWSLLLDVRIILKTLEVVLRRKGAY